MVSQAGRIVLRLESGLELPGQPTEVQAYLSDVFDAEPGQIQVFGRQQWLAPVASGSNPPEAMVVCPCTTGMLSAVACGASNDLMERAADVMLKERRKLILVVRETPLS
jgi:4-hydroxy-3-polyprenylbenzoate decarboxylase